MLLNSGPQLLLPALVAVASAFSPMDTPFPKYNNCARSKPASAEEAFHFDHGCTSFFVGLGILADIVPLPSSLSPRTPPPQQPLPDQVRPVSRGTGGGFMPLPMENMYTPQDIASRKIGQAMTSAFSFGGFRRKREAAAEGWMKKGTLKAGWMRSGKKRNTRMPARRLSSPVPALPPPIFGAVPPPMIPLDFDQKKIDRQICAKFTELSKQLVKGGQIHSVCCDLACYCEELERNTTEVCGGRFQPFTNFPPPPPPLFPLAGSKFGPAPMMGGFPLPFRPPAMPLGPENFTVPVQTLPKKEEKLAGGKKP